MSAADVVAAVRRERLVAILRSTRPERLPDAAAILVDEGITTLEFPLTSPDVLPAITEAVRTLGERASVGAGTVRTVDDASRAIAAGAAFLVSPNLSPPVIEHAAAHDVAVLPGVLTATELDTALQAGATLVKLFPAGAFTPDYLRLLRTPYPAAEVVPTGGVGLADAPGWLTAGAVALGVGSPLTGDTIDTGDFAQLRERARAWKEAVA
jgi:2-dehydro-3-deoxyphosphogluconate aldolase/(4S)-4-hydroxy-2-oxoglutarate aldolase